ncbi:hypothetical protein JL09_g6056 [Pichia kudriavzevii]|uniref:Uncharacterized protein n=1 Tax=Pichia kudriavzevii TaxID=4909 RepID=A0A099NQI8_PICKU|nr:hypothetical protein JL09_g6056 [Pichia kudriavzevii]
MRPTKFRRVKTITKAAVKPVAATAALTIFLVFDET